MILGGLVGGGVLAGLSVAQTRWLLGRRASNPDDSRLLEQRAWAAYLVLAALIYVGFALREGGEGWMGVELGGVAFYGLFAVLGALRWPWLVAVGWALHAGWDTVVHTAQTDAFVPAWYRWLCLGFDLVAAGWLARLQVR